MILSFYFLSFPFLDSCDGFFLQGDAKNPLIASAVRAEKLTIDGKPFDVRKGELFIVVEMGERWKVKPMERRSGDVYLPLDLLQVSLSGFLIIFFSPKISFCLF